MKREEAEALVARMEKENIVNIINGKMQEKLGVDVDFKLSVREDYRHDCYISLKEGGEDSKRQLTSTPLLHSMFRDAEIYCDSYFYPAEGEMTSHAEDELVGTIQISYHHPEGGGNGLRLARLIVWLDSKVVVITTY